MVSEMFYEEKIIDGVLHCRSDPAGQWMIVLNQKAAAISALTHLTGAERVDVFAFFCLNCGCDDPKCQCWNDD